MKSSKYYKTKNTLSRMSKNQSVPYRKLYRPRCDNRLIFTLLLKVLNASLRSKQVKQTKKLL